MSASPGVLVASSLALAATLLSAQPAAGAMRRGVPAVAEIVAAKGDEQVSFVEEPAWRVAEIKQDLAQGDALRTGAYGALAILFRDATQIRVHRNSSLLVKAVRDRAGAGETLLRLERGAAWSRARARLPDKLRMETPAATAAIRGTDWHLRVAPGGRSTLVVLEGIVDFFNDQGRVTVVRGEIAVAEVGRAPVKSILLNPRDRPQWELVLTADWVRIVPVSGLTPGRLAPERRRLEALTGADLGARLDLAEVLYELGEYSPARDILAAAAGTATGPVERGRVRLIEALLVAAEYRFEEARDGFREAAALLDGRRNMIALVSQYLVLAAQRRYPEAEAALAAAASAHPEAAEVALARIHLLSLRNELEAARAAAEQVATRIPTDSRFPVWLAHLALVADEPERMKAAVEQALALDPGDYLAWHVLGTYHQFVVPDGRAAIAAYRRALAILPTYAPSWNNLALVHLEQGNYERALPEIRRAMALAPRDALYAAAHAAVLTVVLERLDEAEGEARRALELEPGHSGALMALGSAALRRGDPDEAVNWLLRATLANPGLAGATTSLAVAQYQAGDHDEARRSIDTALRLDPHDAVTALVGSAMAQDQADAGRAIRLAREGAARFERYPSLAIENLAHPQSGIVNLGAAYASLGLPEWGDYHGQRAFSPHDAASHFFAATLYPSEAARRGSNVQGLLLDPLAVSARARYLDLVRQPFHDQTLGASVGAEGRALVHGQVATLQGLVRNSPPVAYLLELRREHAEGPRDNDARTSERGVLALGARLDHRNDLVLSIGASHTRTGIPGSTEQPDPDDRTEGVGVGGALGYHHRLGPDNHLLARVTGTYGRDRFTNDRPLGLGLSNLSASLINTFGVGGAQAAYATGVCDASAVFFPPGPNFGLGAACGFFGLPLLRSDLGNDLDLKTIQRVDTTTSAFQLQLRHMLDLDRWRVTYGAEWAPALVERRIRRAALVAGPASGLLIPLPPAPTLVFPFGGTTLVTDRGDLDRVAVLAYGDVTWSVAPALTLEVGLAARYLAGHGLTNMEWDPRAGLAWRVAPGHWLRLAGERALLLPIDGTLAPVATVGLVVPVDFATEGSAVTSYRLRWDAEWSERVFTFLEGEQRRINRYAVALPQTLDAIGIERGTLTGLVAGANVWVGERWGLFARHRWAWAANTSQGPDRHRDLPLIPGHAFDAGLTWVHPWQIRATAFASYIGRRAADPAHTRDLDGYWTMGASVTWQPWAKRWSFTLTGQNLANEDYELAHAVPASGRSITLAAEYRFGGR